jgi:transposase
VLNKNWATIATEEDAIGYNVAQKLDEVKVRKIKQLLIDGMPQVEIAQLFSVNYSTIYDIRVGKTWKHIKIENEAAIPKLLSRRLTENEAGQIKQLVLGNIHSVQAIAKMFNVSDNTIRAIKVGKAWKSLAI